MQRHHSAGSALDLAAVPVGDGEDQQRLESGQEEDEVRCDDQLLEGDHIAARRAVTMRCIPVSAKSWLPIRNGGVETGIHASEEVSGSP